MTIIFTAKETKKAGITIIMRVKLSAKQDYKINTHLTIEAKDYDTVRLWFKHNHSAKAKLTLRKLNELKQFITDNLNEALRLNILIETKYLNQKINDYNNNTIKAQKDETLLLTAFDNYLYDLAAKRAMSNEQNRTLLTVHTAKNKVIEFQKSKSIQLKLTDINLKFRADYEAFFNEKNYSANYFGSNLKKIKTVVRHARARGAVVSDQLEIIKNANEATLHTYLSFNELEIIKNTQMPNEQLENAKAWLLIGCFTGQRVSDLLKMTTITKYKDINTIQIQQQKTSQLVIIPIVPIVQEILNNNGGKFPKKISDLKFNNYIKEVCRIAGITELTKSDKIVNKRKKRDMYKKYELISSHVCRRSFCTNLYGEMPTALIMQISGHKKEAQFLEYIKKASDTYVTDIHAHMLAVNKKYAI